MSSLSPDQRRALAGVRKKVSSSNITVFWEGVELLRSLDDPDICAIFSAGLEVDEGGCVQISKGCEVHRRAKARHRMSLAVEVLSLAGALQGLTRLNLSRQKTVVRVEGLASATALTSLSLNGCVGLQSIEPLGRCTGLEELDLSYCRGIRSVEELGACTGLRRLMLTNCRSLKNLNGLERCSSLSFLDLFLCRVLRGKYRKTYTTREAVVDVLGRL